MSLNITFKDRYFQALPPLPYRCHVKSLSWSVFGGPDQATFTSQAPYDHLFHFLALLRAPVMVSDCFSNSVWWGFINEIQVSYQQSFVRLSLDDLFNKVKILYTYISPNNQINTPLLETPFADDAASQEEYGIKERILLRENIDDDLALALRDTFLKTAAQPRTTFAPAEGLLPTQIILSAKGWFHTLGWRFYQNLEGYYANHGPGPGTQVFGSNTAQRVSQHFKPGIDCALSQAFFLIRKIGTPVNKLHVRVVSSDGSQPVASLGSSDEVPGSALSNAYQWIKFNWDPPVPLAANTPYFLTLRTDTLDNAHHYAARTDENLNYSQPDMFAIFYNGASWGSIPSATSPGSKPPLYFRAITVKDTGDLLLDLAKAAGGFFTGIQSFQTGILSSPFRNNHHSVEAEILTLLKNGTIHQRLILANVTPERRLVFYEQPDPNIPTAYMDPTGVFYTPTGQRLPAWSPPIGQFTALKGIDRFNRPFDLKRTPNCFLDKYHYHAYK